MLEIMLFYLILYIIEVLLYFMNAFIVLTSKLSNSNYASVLQ